MLVHPSVMDAIFTLPGNALKLKAFSFTECFLGYQWGVDKRVYSHLVNYRHEKVNNKLQHVHVVRA